ncbi:GAF domain-containing protein [Arthrobacter sp. CAN_A2]|uniref:ANTAR domain-containing protein n=1 Tax=Arthrobacter sp. CAN_A2 TaxID=2787718 RepID=UPI0018F045B6
MVTRSRPEKVSTAFVRLADTLVADYDVLDLLHTLAEECVDLLQVDQVGILLASPLGDLQVVASTSEQSELVEILHLQAGEGPCIECYHSGAVVSIADIAALGKWPAFREAALRQGFASVHVVPLRIHDRVIGAMGLFCSEIGDLAREDAMIAQALASVATISLLQERTIRESQIVNDQLQRALNSRIMIEQAKGVIAQISTVTMDEAFNRLRNHARSTHQTLNDTSQKVIDRTLLL